MLAGAAVSTAVKRSCSVLLALSPRLTTSASSRNRNGAHSRMAVERRLRHATSTAHGGARRRAVVRQQVGSAAQPQLAAAAARLPRRRAAAAVHCMRPCAALGAPFFQKSARNCCASLPLSSRAPHASATSTQERPIAAGLPCSRLVAPRGSALPPECAAPPGTAAQPPPLQQLLWAPAASPSVASLCHASC